MQRHTNKVEKDNHPLMLDVDEYLNMLNNNEETMFDKNPYSSIDSAEGISKIKKDDDESDTCSRADSTVDKKQTSGTLGNQTRVGTSSSSKNNTSLFGKGKKDMKNFMKNQLSKTKQTGNNAVFMIGKLFKV